MWLVDLSEVERSSALKLDSLLAEDGLARSVLWHSDESLLLSITLAESRDEEELSLLDILWKLWDCGLSLWLASKRIEVDDLS